MIFAKITPDALSDPKLLRVGPFGFSLWAKGLLISKLHQLDGFVPEVVMPMISQGDPNPQETAQSLVTAGLWKRVDGGYTVGAQKWAEFQTTREEVEAKRSNWRRWKREQRATKGGEGHGGAPDGGDNAGPAKDNSTDVLQDRPANVLPPEYRAQNTENPSPAGGEPTPQGIAPAEQLKLRWAEFRAAYPKRGGGYDWPKAERKFMNLSREGADPAKMVAGAYRYRQSCDSQGNTGSPFVKMPATWLNARGWLDDYETGPFLKGSVSEAPPLTLACEEAPAC